MKQCIKCGEVKDERDFSLIKSRGKLNGKCKLCVTKYVAARYLSHKDEIKVYSQIYMGSHKDEIKVYGAVYRESHKEEIAIRKAIYYKNNKVAIAAKKAIYYKNNKVAISGSSSLE